MVWIGIGFISLYFIITSAIVASHPVEQPDYSLPLEKFRPLDALYWNYQYSIMHLIISLLVFVILNTAGFFFSNERYHWIGLKECAR